MWFVLESLGTMPEAALDEAAGLLSEELARLMPACAIARQTIGFR